MKKNNMALILLKKISLIFLLFSAAVFITSFAGRTSKSLHNSESRNVATMHEELKTWEQSKHDEGSEIHGRLLKVKTNDYGRYDPTPTLVKPRFKLIPN